MLDGGYKLENEISYVVQPILDGSCKLADVN